MQFIKSCISLGSCTSTASQLIGSAVSRRTTITYAVTFTDAFGDTSTVASDKAVVTIAAGQAAIRSFSFAVKNSTPSGTYFVTVTASDVTGSVNQTGHIRSYVIRGVQSSRCR